MKDWEAAYLAGIIDGEGSITLTRLHKNEYRRPCISISSNDMEMLQYIQKLAGGNIYTKKNYNPRKHKDSFTLYFKKKQEVFKILQETHTYLRINKKRKRSKWILQNYDAVTPRNGKYTRETLNQKLLFEKKFFEL
ncbi:LAGLIDADG family homing endonuclease [Virgibacillus soli]|uniref:LAGLIDADG family homing endonuclease n=1 Tax=Paracerasibacillus soli TaxID=480284 RepID=UPI0035EFA88D